MDKNVDKKGLIIGIIFLITMTLFAMYGEQIAKNDIENEKGFVYIEKIEKIPIVSLSDMNGIKGDFVNGLFVQSSKINNEKYYEVMLVGENHSDKEILYQYLPLKATDTKTFEFKDESKREAYIKIKWEIKKENGKEISDDFFRVVPPHPYLEQIQLFTDTKGVIQEISIHAPKGTINKNFLIDFSKER